MQLAAIYHSQGDLKNCLEAVQHMCQVEPENKVRPSHFSSLICKECLLQNFIEILASLLNDLGNKLKLEGTAPQKTTP